MKSFNIRNLSTTIRGIVFIFLFTTLMACTSGLVFHTFEFNAFADSPDIQVLDYRYGNTKTPMARATEFQKINGGVLQRSSIGGDMLVGDSLYVKWKIKATNKVYEDTVDLKKLLPRNMENHRVYFMIQDKQLYVYLVTPNRRLQNEEPNGPKASNYLKTITLSSNFGREVTTQ